MNNLSGFETFMKNLEVMARTFARKNHDYASGEGTYFNFEYAAMVAAPFEGVDKVFATMLGIKLARLAVLKKGTKPKNETMLETHKDNSTYSAIWWSYCMEQEKANERRRWLRTRLRKRLSQTSRRGGSASIRGAKTAKAPRRSHR